jgi:hypothetical protein
MSARRATIRCFEKELNGKRKPYTLPDGAHFSVWASTILPQDRYPRGMVDLRFFVPESKAI